MVSISNVVKQKKVLKADAATAATAAANNHPRECKI